MKYMNRYRHLSDSELAQKQWQVIQDMPKSYLTEVQVNELYAKGLRIRYQKATVFWPVFGDRLSPDQINPLKWELESDARTIFIPINDGSHWDFVVLEKQEDSGEWQARKVETPADGLGLCGQHTVEQSMKILDQGLEVYSVANPGLVRELNQDDAIFPQIKQVLNQEASGDTSTTDTSTGVAATAEDRDTQIAVKQSLKYMSRFDYVLAKLAEYEMLTYSYSIESLREELAQMLADMTPDARESTINRLKLSNLAQKPSVAKVIDGCHQKLNANAPLVMQQQIATNRHLFMPMPKPNSVGRLTKEQEDEYYYSSKSSLAGG